MFVFEIGTLILLSLKALKTALTPRQAPHCYLAVCNVCLICIDIVRTCMTFVDTTYIYPYKCGCVGEPQHYLQMVNWVFIAIAEGGCTTTTACCGEVLQPRGRDMLPKKEPVNMVPSVCCHNWLLVLSVILSHSHTQIRKWWQSNEITRHCNPAKMTSIQVRIFNHLSLPGYRVLLWCLRKKHEGSSWVGYTRCCWQKAQSIELQCLRSVMHLVWFRLCVEFQIDKQGTPWTGFGLHMNFSSSGDAIQLNF